MLLEGQLVARKMHYVFELLGHTYREGSKIGALRRVIKELSHQRDDFLEELSKVVFNKRRIIARDPAELNPDRPDLVEKNSERLEGGWWLYKNVGEEHIVASMGKACDICGFQYRKDLKLVSDNWRTKGLTLDDVWRRLGVARSE